MTAATDDSGREANDQTLVTVLALWDGTSHRVFPWIEQLRLQTLEPAQYEGLLLVPAGVELDIPALAAAAGQLELAVLPVQADDSDWEGQVGQVARGRFVVNSELDSTLPPDFLAQALRTRARGTAKPTQTIRLDYPIDPVPRWGHGRPPHPQLTAIFEQGRERYERLIDDLSTFEDALARIPRDRPADEHCPYWSNPWLPPFDAIALYGLLGLHAPKRYLEVGSGNSTKFARRAIDDLGLGTRITSIDPAPRAEIDRLCDEVVREPVETTQLTRFEGLEAGDILFVDNSHRVFTNSDATVMVLDVLPRLREGVLVQFHDIYLPWDYPQSWADRFYSEQYLLAALLLGGGRRYEVVLPNLFVLTDDALGARVAPWFERPPWSTVPNGGGSLWLRIAAG